MSMQLRLPKAVQLSVYGLCLVACGHAQSATPPVAAQTATADPAQERHEAVATQAQDAGAAVEAPQLPAAKPPAGSESITTFMKEHFLIVTYARDLIIGGELEDLRTPLFALANYGYETVAPGGWMKGVAQLQAASKLTAEAETLGAAAKGVATMARICGQCHLEQGGPEMPKYEREKKGPKSDQLDSRMARHAWAAELMWEGLIAPSDSAWQAGATALSQAPAAAPVSHPALSKKMVDGLRAVRGLGVRASNASSAEQREGVYSELLVTCANCHRQQTNDER